MNVPARVRWLWLTLLVVVLDRGTKAWFETQTVEGWRHEVAANFIYLVHSQNPGVAFGVLADSASIWTRVGLIAGSVVVIAVLAWMLVANRSGGALSCCGFGVAARRSHGQCHGPHHARRRDGFFRSVAWQLPLACFQRGGFGDRYRRGVIDHRCPVWFAPANTW